MQRIATAVGMILIGTLSVLEGANTYSSLLNKSPFLPPDFNAEGPAVAAPPAAANTPISQQLNFRGIYQIGDEYRFLIGEKRRQYQASWVAVGGSGGEGDIQVKEFREEDSSVLVSYNGMEGWLQMDQIESNTSGAPATVSAPTPPNVQPTRPTTTPRPVVRPTTRRTSSVRPPRIVSNRSGSPVRRTITPPSSVSMPAPASPPPASLPNEPSERPPDFIPNDPPNVPPGMSPFN